MKLEHAAQERERGVLVLIREARVDVGHRKIPRRFVAGIGDSRHQSLLLSFENCRLGRIVGLDPVGPQLASGSNSSFTVVSRSTLAVRGTYPCSIEPGSHSTDRHIERGCDLVVAELLPRVQQHQRCHAPRPGAGRRRRRCAARGSWRRRSRRRDPRGRCPHPVVRVVAVARICAPRCGGVVRSSWSRSRTATAARRPLAVVGVTPFDASRQDLARSKDSASSTPTRRTRYRNTTVA